VKFVRSSGRYRSKPGAVAALAVSRAGTERSQIRFCGGPVSIRSVTNQRTGAFGRRLISNGASVRRRLLNNEILSKRGGRQEYASKTDQQAGSERLPFSGLGA
jgi:hypothetical protein